MFVQNLTVERDKVDNFLYNQNKIKLVKKNIELYSTVSIFGSVMSPQRYLNVTAPLPHRYLTVTLPLPKLTCVLELILFSNTRY